jgi:hypothetical protein
VSDDRRQAAQATVIVLVNPQTMTSEELINEAPPSGLGATSVGLPVGDELWVGSFRGDRLVRYRLPRTTSSAVRPTATS